jgi:hypothetical protein
VDFRWNEWNVEHIAKHGVQPDEAERVIRHAKRPYPRYHGDNKWLAMNKRKQAKPFWEMNTEELAAATAEFDKEFIADTFRPMTAVERARWRRIKRKPGRPRNGRGVKVISVSVEKELLKQSDALAKRLGISRAQLVARGLKGMLLTVQRKNET